MEKPEKQSRYQLLIIYLAFGCVLSTLHPFFHYEVSTSIMSHNINKKIEALEGLLTCSKSQN